MAGMEILVRRQAQALQEAIQTAECLLGGETPSERLMSAQNDVMGRTMPDVVFSMLVSELTRVVAAQEEGIQGLKARLPAEAAEGD